MAPRLATYAVQVRHPDLSVTAVAHRAARTGRRVANVLASSNIPVAICRWTLASILGERDTPARPLRRGLGCVSKLVDGVEGV